MQDVFIKDIDKYIDKQVRLKGWVRNIRHSGKLLFIILRDGTGELQTVAFQPDLGDEKFELAKRLTLESSVIICGIPKPHPKKENVYELAVSDVMPIQIADEYPISKKEHGPEFIDNKSLLGDYVTSEELRACTTCNACVEECPVNISPLNIILELRRNLIMEQSDSPTEWNNMFANMENNQAPWQFSPSDRLNWKSDLN